MSTLEWFFLILGFVVVYDIVFSIYTKDREWGENPKKFKWFKR